MYSASAFKRFGWHGVIPKLEADRLLRAWETLLGNNSYRFPSDVSKSFGSHELHFSKLGYNWLTFCVTKPPVTGRNGEPRRDVPGRRNALFRIASV